MIDNKEVLPFNFFDYGGKYSGVQGGMRYLIKRAGDKPDFKLIAYCWPGPLGFDYTAAEKKTEAEFEYSEEGREEAIAWLKDQYQDRIDEWNNIPALKDIEL